MIKEPEIRVLSASHMKHEPSSYHLIRAKGQNAINFVHFLTPIIVFNSGIEVNMARGSCIVYTPGVRQEYKSTREGIVNNFVTFDADIKSFVSRYCFPFNEPFYIRDDEQISRCVDSIAWAAANKLEKLDEKITGWVLELFAELNKNYINPSPKERREEQIKQRFTILRGEISVAPKNWTVEKMAAAVWLTRSRFCVVYKSFFGVSPSADLEAATLDYAKERLLNTTDPVAVIAEDCGYKHVESFIRVFSARTGVTPGAFRKN